MTRNPRHSLRTRLLAWLLAAIVVATLAQAGLAYTTALSQADVIFDRHLQKMAAALASGVALGSLPPNEEVSDDRASEDFVVQMWNARGDPIFRSAAHQRLRQPAQPGFSLVHALDGREYRVYAQASPGLTLLVAQDMDARRDMARTLALRTILPTLPMTPLLALIAWLVVSRSLAPVARLRAQMAARKVDELAPLNDRGLPAEIQPLIQELNLLFERLRQAFDSQRVFVADAAHELRSPLAALKIQLQGLQRAGDDPTRELAVKRLAAGIDRAGHLVDQMLVLARQEASVAEGVALESLDLAQPGFLALSDTLASAQARQIDLGVHRAESVTVAGNAESLRILVRNLLDNGVKYTPPGGTVDLSVHATPDGALVTVEDSGPGIPEKDRARALDRFYRVVDGAGATGSGLGLAIVKSIADMHGATIVLDDSRRLGGLRVRVSFGLRSAA
ncbi:MAG: sensor histidine kinase N-terminal domain-containing protein [Burkholderiales bacterium]|nr:sensor histidine kinase N-terminal domain-containing protein [Burkholderiales bacterium]